MFLLVFVTFYKFVDFIIQYINSHSILKNQTTYFRQFLFLILLFYYFIKSTKHKF